MMMRMIFLKMTMMRGRKVPLSEAVANLLPLGLKATAARLVMSTYIKFDI